MIVPKINADIFLQACPLPSSTSREVTDFVQEIAHGHLDDFSSSHTGYFSVDSKAAISKIAGEKFCTAIQANMTRADAQKAWSAVVRDFHASSNWNFGTQVAPEKVIKPRTGAGTVARYFWAFFNSMVIIKTGILFLGAEAAENPNPMYKYILWAAIVFSFLNLFWFAYKEFHREEALKRDRPPLM